MRIPFSPPFIDEEIVQEVTDTLRSGWITTGPKVRALEAEIAAMVGARNALCCNSATAGLMLVLKWFGVGPGDEVVVPAYTYCATALAVVHLGARPVLADVEDDFNLSPATVRKLITPRTKAIVAVDIAGWPCDYAALAAMLGEPETISRFTPDNEVQHAFGRPLLVSDSAHALGAVYEGRPFGTQADFSVFSFHAVKNLTTAEGGCIVSAESIPVDRDAVFKRLRLMTLNGQTRDAFTKTQTSSWRYDIVLPGFKMNMPDVCAAIGLAQMRNYASELLPRRRAIVDRYREALAAMPWAWLPPIEDERRSSSRHLFMLRVHGIDEADRDRMIDFCFQRGVAVNVHFVPLTQLTWFKENGHSERDTPNAVRLSSCEITLPVYPQLTDAEVDLVVATIRAAYEEIVGAAVASRVNIAS
jgi:dTDP-4-amino-4,6-dideoxygalactose transaminase